MSRRGFTIVELAVVMTIMAILLSLGIFGMIKSQVSARDTERKNDIDIIARGLEQRYRNGNPRATSSDGSEKPGRYPNTAEFYHMFGFSIANWTPAQISGGYVTDNLPGTNESTFNAPTGEGIDTPCTSSCAPAETMWQIQYGNGGSGTDSGKYIYEPIDKNGAICTSGECVRFNLYYKQEATGTIMKVSSERQ